MKVAMLLVRLSGLTPRSGCFLLVMLTGGSRADIDEGKGARRQQTGIYGDDVEGTDRVGCRGIGWG